MPRRTKDSVKELARIRSAIAGLVLAGTISLESAATHLATTPRTLQRRLSNHGINFWALVEHNRFEIASALLRETDLKVQEIAARLGYGTPSTFARAFTRWSGHSPNAYRTAHANRFPVGE
ncbi:helix-turn-helix transcriptional regulator [uncultured Roseibium sp.]|uniref:helix-turn-helix transcriptional regulator n=1 Tax=uncultured Roseibium sp. TaxID=1936171 RepID=UPI00374A1A2C